MHNIAKEDRDFCYKQEKALEESAEAIAIENAMIYTEGYEDGYSEGYYDGYEKAKKEFGK